MDAVIGCCRQLDRILSRSTLWTLTIMVLLMILLMMLAILGRQFSITFLWLEPLVRHLVFFCCFLGAGEATSLGKHIRIDIVDRLLEQRQGTRLARALKLVTTGFVLVIVGWLTRAGIAFVHSEWQYGHEAFLGIHSAVLVAAIPVGFCLIGLRFLLVLVLPKEES